MYIIRNQYAYLLPNIKCIVKKYYTIHTSTEGYTYISYNCGLVAYFEVFIRLMNPSLISYSSKTECYLLLCIQSYIAFFFVSQQFQFKIVIGMCETCKNAVYLPP